MQERRARRANRLTPAREWRFGAGCRRAWPVDPTGGAMGAPDGALESKDAEHLAVVAKEAGVPKMDMASRSMPLAIRRRSARRGKGDAGGQ